MPLENQQIIVFRARGVFDASTVYRANDWIAYNGIPYLASRNIAAGNPPNDVDNPTNGWASVSAIPLLKACPVYKAFKATSRSPSISFQQRNPQPPQRHGTA